MPQMGRQLIKGYYADALVFAEIEVFATIGESLLMHQYI